MRLTLITICLNSVRTLRRTVESVLSQTRLPDEYIFVDGGSTDGTLALLDELAEALHKAGVETRIINQEHRPGEAGIPSAWNQGLATASGDVIGLLNSDDWYETSALETVERTLETHPEAGLACGGTRFVIPGKGEKKVFWPGSFSSIYWRMPVPHPGLFVRKAVYDTIGLYDTAYKVSADYDFVWRCCTGNVTLAPCGEVVSNMELGGFANSSRKLARYETRVIALRHGRSFMLPWLAWLIRTMTGR